MGESSIYPDSASSPGNDSNDALHVNSDPLNNDSASHEFNCDPGGKNFSKSPKNIDSLNSNIHGKNSTEKSLFDGHITLAHGRRNLFNIIAI